MKLSIESVTKILEEEIKWCENNPDPTITQDYQLGFIDGLRQASNIFLAFEKMYGSQIGIDVAKPNTDKTVYKEVD